MQSEEVIKHEDLHTKTQSVLNKHATLGYSLLTRQSLYSSIRSHALN